MKLTHTQKVLNDAIIQLSNKEQVISSNIANLDTPEYKAKTTNFDAMMTESLKKKNDYYEKNFLQTNDKHFDLSDDFTAKKKKFEILQKNNYLSQNDNNDVDLDIENMEMSKTNILMNATLTTYQKHQGEYRKLLDAMNKLN